ncbi:MAG: hypothetical protein ABI407_17270 [Bradyrhizobium sp.]
MFLAMTGEAFSEPKRVLLLHSFGRDFAPWSEYARTFREELNRQSSDPIDLYEASLATARFPDEEEGPFVEYLRALFTKHRLDLVVAIGSPAVGFVQRHRQELFPSTPAVYTGVEQRRVSYAALTTNDAVIAINNDFAAVVENILRVLPETADIIVVIGNSPIERFWAEQLRIAFRPFEKRVTFTWFNELSFEEMLKRAATLPRRSAIFFALLSVDAAGVPHEAGKALDRLYAIADVPIFSESSVFFGRGIVWGTAQFHFRVISGGCQCLGTCFGRRNTGRHQDGSDRIFGAQIRLERTAALGNQRKPTAGGKRCRFSSPGNMGTVQVAGHCRSRRSAASSRSYFLAAVRT